MASSEAARLFRSSARVSRREVLDALPPVPADRAYRFLSRHRAAVLDAASRRLIPMLDDDRLGLDRRGTYEVHVVAYVDRLLSQCHAPSADVHPGGLSSFARRMRVADLRDQYTNGIAMLDQQAGGDFTAVPRLCQDLILSQTQVAPFTSLLFEHIVEAMYAAPDLAGRAPSRDT